MIEGRRLGTIVSMILILICVGLPTANAETFDIGEKVSKSDLHQTWYNYSSGTYLKIDSCSEEQKYENITAMFDGNTSTGLDGEYFSDGWDITLYFSNPLYVNNITILPSFGEGTTNYSIGVIFGINREMLNVSPTDTPQFYHINHSLDGIEMRFHIYGSKLYFNDVIINYTPHHSNLDDLQSQLENLEARIFQLESENTVLKNEVENLTSEVENLKNAPEEPDTFLAYLGIILGIIGIIIALVAIVLARKKLESKIPFTDTKEPVVSQVEQPP